MVKHETAAAPRSPAPDRGRATRVRWVVAAFCFGGLAINYVDRAALSVALPFMTQDLSLTPTEQGLILSAFSWTYAVMQLPAGWLIDRFGARIMYGACVLWWSVFTGLTALASSFGVLLGFRLGLGIGESGAYPASAKAVSLWFPPSERGRATAFYDSGARIGSALAVPIITAIIAGFGWHAAFVVMAALGVLWTIGWWSYYRSPKSHPGPNAAERAHITGTSAVTSTGTSVESSSATSTGTSVDTSSATSPGASGGAPTGASVGATARASAGASAAPERRGSVAWLLRHRVVWGMIGGFSCLNFVVTFFLTWFPSYLVQDRGFDLLKLGFFGMIPGLTAVAGGWAGGIAGDWLLKRGWSLTRTRKTCLVAGMLLSSTVAAAVLVESAALALALLSISYAAIAFAIVSLWCLPADVAPAHQVATLGGLQNFAANIASALSPIVIGALAQATGSFVVPLLVTGVVAVLGALCFGLLIRKVEPIAG
ncbi:MFS transporter [Nonomuraea sp. NPDC048901]|uniref:MFS transporter n=1 Tax=Nonomuraea sp. NPDC048901 TaxID=3155627 RepID=UPI0033D8EBFF